MNCAGGAADKTKVLKVGDEILAVNNTDCTRMSRIEAWNFMKKLSDGTASLIVRQKLAGTGEKGGPAQAPAQSSSSGAAISSEAVSKSPKAEKLIEEKAEKETKQI